MGSLLAGGYLSSLSHKDRGLMWAASMFASENDIGPRSVSDFE